MDLNRDPRPVALSYRELNRMYADEPLLDQEMWDLLGGGGAPRRTEEVA